MCSSISRQFAGTHEVLGSKLQHNINPAHVCNPGTWWRQEDQNLKVSHSQLHSESEASLGYIRPCLNVKNKTKQFRVKKKMT